MSDAKHTPGPWVVYNYPHVPDHPWIEAKCNFSPKPEPDSGSYYLSVSGPISQEDAHLIAAAPDLLAALEDTTKALEQFVDVSAELRKPYDHPLSVYDRACAVIAKARGQA